MGEQIKGALVASAGAHGAVQPRHGFRVVIQDVGRASSTMRNGSSRP